MRFVTSFNVVCVVLALSFAFPRVALADVGVSPFDESIEDLYEACQAVIAETPDVAAAYADNKKVVGQLEKAVKDAEKAKDQFESGTFPKSVKKISKAVKNMGGRWNKAVQKSGNCPVLTGYVTAWMSALLVALYALVSVTLITSYNYVDAMKKGTQKKHIKADEKMRGALTVLGMSGTTFVPGAFVWTAQTKKGISKSAAVLTLCIALVLFIQAQQSSY